MNCWKCGATLDLTRDGRIGFRTECDRCGSGLHCCVNCQYYKPGMPNDCLVLGTEFIADRERNNFCEEFKAKGTGPEKKVDPKDVLKRLFGDEA